MRSVVPKEKYAECRLCGTIVSSSKPVCQKCGLQTSSIGIEELAEIDDQISNALSDANSLILLASIAFFLSIGNIFYFFLVDRNAVWFNLPLWISYLYFGISYLKWHKNYSKIIFNNCDFEEIKKAKKKSLIFIGYSMALGFGLLIF